MPRKVVLVVDDNSLDLALLKEYLKKYFSVITAESGIEAISNTMDGSPDAILLDIQMVNINGLEVLKKLKNNVKTWNIPVILLTGFYDEAQEKLARKLGCAEYLIKPFKKDLQDIILKHIKE